MGELSRCFTWKCLRAFTYVTSQIFKTYLHNSVCLNLCENKILNGVETRELDGESALGGKREDHPTTKS